MVIEWSLNGATPGFDDATPGFDGATPGFDGATPGSDGGPPGSDDAIPGSDGAKPGFDGATPGFDGATTRSDRATPGFDDAPQPAQWGVQKRENETGKSRTYHPTWWDGWGSLPSHLGGLPSTIPPYRTVCHN